MFARDALLDSTRLPSAGFKTVALDRTIFPRDFSTDLVIERPGVAR